jgi:hypothetical protein
MNWLVVRGQATLEYVFCSSPNLWIKCTECPCVIAEGWKGFKYPILPQSGFACTVGRRDTVRKKGIWVGAPRGLGHVGPEEPC